MLGRLHLCSIVQCHANACYQNMSFHILIVIALNLQKTG